jgi:hypothetical protein
VLGHCMNPPAQPSGHSSSPTGPTIHPSTSTPSLPCRAGPWLTQAAYRLEDREGRSWPSHVNAAPANNATADRHVAAQVHGSPPLTAQLQRLQDMQAMLGHVHEMLTHEQQDAVSRLQELAPNVVVRCSHRIGMCGTVLQDSVRNGALETGQ